MAGDEHGALRRLVDKDEIVGGDGAEAPVELGIGAGKGFQWFHGPHITTVGRRGQSAVGRSCHWAVTRRWALRYDK